MVEETLASLGDPLLVGSAFTGLMVWRDLDYVVDSRGCAAPDVWRSIVPLLVRCERLSYRDETGSGVAETAPYERHYFVLQIDGWKLDVSVWTAGAPPDLERFQHTMRARLDAETRLAILRLKDAWHSDPAYPELVGAFEIYDAVLEQGVRNLHELDGYLAERGLPTRVR